MAGRYTLRWDAGADIDSPFVWCNPTLDDAGQVVRDDAGNPVPNLQDPIDLTGMTGRMQIRRSKQAPEVLLTLTTENGGIAIDDPTAGVVRIVATAEQTAALRSGVYDLELVSATGRVTRLIEGPVRVSEETTR